MGSWKVIARRAALGVVLTGTVLGVFYLLLVPFADLISSRAIADLSGKERVDADNATKQLVLVAIGGAFAAISVVFTARTYISNRRGQVTDRFIKAVGLLSSKELDERLGGIYSLQHIMNESSQDHDAVLQVLAACVREHSAKRLKAFVEDARIHPDDYDPGDEPEKESASDIQATIAVIATRPKRDERIAIDFSGAHLYHVQMLGGDFEDALFESSNLYKCTFTQTELKRVRFVHCAVGTTDFSGANLSESYLMHTNFAACKFDRVNLENALLVEIDFRFSSLTHIRADGARFHDIDFRDVYVPQENSSTWTGARFTGSSARIPVDLAKYFVQSGATLDLDVKVLLKDQKEVSAATWLKSRSATSPS